MYSETYQCVNQITTNIILDSLDFAWLGDKVTTLVGWTSWDYVDVNLSMKN